MKKFVIGIVLFLFPTKFARLILFFLKNVHISKSSHVGFSLLLVDELILEEGASIGSLNLIKCSSLKLKKNAFIRHLNIIKGLFDIIIEEKGEINRNNTIVNSLDIEELRKVYSKSVLDIGYNAIIGVNHFMDLTGSVSLGANSIIAGRSSELWTHGYYHAKKGSKRWMIRGNIQIGDNCYIGSHVIINYGCTICSGATVGAGAIVSKDIDEAGAYVAQPLRHLGFEATQAIQRYQALDGYHYEKKN